MERPQLPPLECKKSFEVEEPLDVNTPDLLVSLQGLWDYSHYAIIIMFCINIVIILTLLLYVIISIIACLARLQVTCLTFLRILSLPQVAWKRRKSLACSSLMARCHWTPKLTAVGFVKVKISASMLSLRIPALALWCPRLPLLPNIHIKRMAAQRSSDRSFPQCVETTSSLACVTPGRERPSGCQRSNHPCWAAISSVWSML